MLKSTNLLENVSFLHLQLLHLGVSFLLFLSWLASQLKVLQDQRRGGKKPTKTKKHMIILFKST